MTAGTGDPIGDHLDDDRLSALLDGEAEPADVSHAEVCVECARRLAGWQAARSLLTAAGASQSPPDGRREAAVQAALAASTSHPGERPAVSPAGRRARLRWSGGGVAALAAAAVVVAGLAFGISQAGHAGSAKTSSATLAPSTSPTSAGSAGASAGAAAGTTTNPGAPAAGTSPAFSASSGALGTFAGTGPLLQALRQRAAAAALPRSTGAPASSPLKCLSSAAGYVGVPPAQGPVLQGMLTFNGIPSEVFVYAESGGHVAALVRTADCALTARIPF